MIVTGRDQIQGWKEIAAHLGRDERTVKRWEKQRGLPVRRIPGAGRANVYLVVAELDAWLAGGSGRQAALDAAQEGELPGSGSPGAGGDSPGEEMPAAGGSGPAHATVPHSLPSPAATASGTEAPDGGAVAVQDRGLSPRRPWARPLVAGVALLVTVAGGAAVAHHFAHPASAASSIRRGADLPTRPSRPALDQLYLQGVYLCEVRTPESLTRARALFQQVLAEEPDNAEAWSGLAKTYLMLREYATMPSDEAYGRAWDAAERALALDPGLSEAHAVVAFIDFFSLWKADDAAREFATAIRLDPGSALAHHWYGSMLMHQARFPEAIEQLNAAQRLSPTSSAILASRALAVGMAGQRDEGIAMLESLIRSDPGAAAPHRNLAFLSLREPRDLPRYLAEMSRFETMQGDSRLERVFDHAAEMLRRRGEAAMWSTLLAEQRQMQPEATHPTLLMADAEAELGHADAAFDDLWTLASQHDHGAVGLVIDPTFAGLHDDPRFRRIAEMLGLAPVPEKMSTAKLQTPAKPR